MNKVLRRLEPTPLFRKSHLSPDQEDYARNVARRNVESDKKIGTKLKVMAAFNILSKFSFLLMLVLGIVDFVRGTNTFSFLFTLVAYGIFKALSFAVCDSIYKSMEKIYAKAIDEADKPKVIDPEVLSAKVPKKAANGEPIPYFDDEYREEDLLFYEERSDSDE